MNYIKYKKNTVLCIFYIFYISVFLFGTMHLDLSRDIRQALDIIGGDSLPLNGQLFGGRFRLGPAWYYFLAALVLVFDSWLCIVMAMAAVSGLQIFIAYLLGKELAGRPAGVLLSALMVFPSWGFFEQLMPTHFIFVLALVMAFFIGAIRYKNKGKVKYLYLQALAFSLALHAHPTALVAFLPAMYFNVHGLIRYGIKTTSLLVIVLLFLLPFSPMLVDQAQSGFPLTDQIFSHTLNAPEKRNWSKVYTLPWSVLLGGNYIPGLVMDRGGLLLPYLIAVATFILLALSNIKVFAKNTMAIMLDIKSGMVFWVLLFAQSAVLVFLSSGHAYYYGSAYRLFILASITIFLTRLTSGARFGQYFIESVILSTCLSGMMLLYGVASWSAQGVFPVNFFPLADISASSSEKILVPTLTAINERKIQAWLCEERFSALHGSLASHLIYSYAVPVYFGCPDKKMIIGSDIGGNGNIYHQAYVGVSEYLGRHVQGKNHARVGGMRIYPASRSWGAAYLPGPAVEIYPPFLAPADAGENGVTQIALKDGDVLAITDLSQNYIANSKVVVQTLEGEDFLPIATDAQTKIYGCKDCNELNLKIIFNSNVKDRIDVVVF